MQHFDSNRLPFLQPKWQRLLSFLWHVRIPWNISGIIPRNIFWNIPGIIPNNISWSIPGTSPIPGAPQTSCSCPLTARSAQFRDN